MERFVIVMPVDTSAYLLPCDDGDTCKLETLQKLVGGPIEMADTCLAASWAREDVDSIQMAVNEEGLLQELPYNEHATDFYADPENQAAFEAWQKQREKCKKTKRPCRRDSTGKAKG